jgi:hypothetical protein
MRQILAIVALVSALGWPVGAAFAGDAPRPRHRMRQPDLDIFVPIDPYEHERLYWKRKSDRDLVPGGVSIDGEPRYVCDLDDEKFDDREAFVAHLRLEHLVPAEQVPGSLVTVDGVIHYAGD